MTHITLQKDTAGKGPTMTGRTGVLARLEMGIVAVRARVRCCGPRRRGELLWQHFLCLFDREASYVRVRPRHTGNAAQSDA